jgi:hypothetical protein
MFVATRLWILIGLLAGTPLLHAQSVPTASRLGDLQIGAGYAVAEPDYGPDRFKGLTAYADFDFFHNFGVELNFRFLKGPTKDLYEKTYETGIRYHRNYGRFAPYGKIMVGRGVFNYQNSVANLAYNMAAGGGGVDFRVKPYLTIRADAEYQRWGGFPPHGLTPLVGSIGVAYHFH